MDKRPSRQTRARNSSRNRFIVVSISSAFDPPKPKSTGPTPSARNERRSRELGRDVGKETALSLIHCWCEVLAVFHTQRNASSTAAGPPGRDDQLAQPYDRRLVARRAVERAGWRPIGYQPSPGRAGQCGGAPSPLSSPTQIGPAVSALAWARRRCR
jgi:hypothetical protein